MEENKVVQKREDKIKKWFSVKYNLALTLILIVAFAIRFYFYLQTQNQPLWWDESEYMSAAKSFAGIGQYHLSTIRLPGFPLMAAAFFFLGIQSEPVIRFFLLFLPSIILIFLTYRIMSEMYSDKRIALISTAILSVLWESLFYSNRFHTENISLIFEFNNISFDNLELIIFAVSTALPKSLEIIFFISKFDNFIDNSFACFFPKEVNGESFHP